jgi:hypothetical protein
MSNDHHTQCFDTIGFELELVNERSQRLKDPEAYHRARLAEAEAERIARREAMGPDAEAHAADSVEASRLRPVDEQSPPGPAHGRVGRWVRRRGGGGV